MLRPHSTAGSTLLAVLAMLAILAAAAATVLPGLVGVLQFERVERAAFALAAYERALGRFAADVAAYPGSIEQLTRQIVSTDVNSCGEPYRNRALKDDGTVWRGPYVTRVIPAHGEIPLEIGDLQNQMERDPVMAQNRNDPGELILHVSSTDLTEARELDIRVDGAADGAAGRVRWGPTDAEGLVALEYAIPVTGC